MRWNPSQPISIILLWLGISKIHPQLVCQHILLALKSEMDAGSHLRLALMIRGGGNAIFSRKDTRYDRIQIPWRLGFCQWASITNCSLGLHYGKGQCEMSWYFLLGKEDPTHPSTQPPRYPSRWWECRDWGLVIRRTARHGFGTGCTIMRGKGSRCILLSISLRKPILVPTKFLFQSEIHPFPWHRIQSSLTDFMPNWSLDILRLHKSVMAATRRLPTHLVHGTSYDLVPWK